MNETRAIVYRKAEQECLNSSFLNKPCHQIFTLNDLAEAQFKWSNGEVFGRHMYSISKHGKKK